MAYFIENISKICIHTQTKGIPLKFGYFYSKSYYLQNIKYPPSQQSFELSEVPMHV